MILLGWWRYKKGRGHLMQPLRPVADASLQTERLISRCRQFVIRKPDRELPLLMPDGWTACKRCLASEAKEGK